MTHANDPIDALIEHLRASQAYLTQLLGNAATIYGQLPHPFTPPTYPEGWPTPAAQEPRPTQPTERAATASQASTLSRHRSTAHQSNPFTNSLYERSTTMEPPPSQSATTHTDPAATTSRTRQDATSPNAQEQVATSTQQQPASGSSPSSQRTDLNNLVPQRQPLYALDSSGSQHGNPLDRTSQDGSPIQPGLPSLGYTPPGLPNVTSHLTGAPLLPRAMWPTVPVTNPQHGTNLINPIAPTLASDSEHVLEPTERLARGLRP